MRFHVFVLALLVVDQAVKWWILHRAAEGPLVGDVLRITITHNTGAAFGLFPGGRTVFVAIGIAAAVVLLYAHRVLPRGDRRNDFLAAILGGNLGNLVDRIRLGHVTDYLDMGIGSVRWPVYNLADVAVVIGAAGLGWWLVRGDRERTPAEPGAIASEETSADAR